MMTTAKGLSRLRSVLRRERQPFIDKGKETLRKFLAEGQVEPSNKIITKITGYFKLDNPQELYYLLGKEEIALDNYVLKDSPKTSPSLLSKIFRIRGRRKRDDADAKSRLVTPDNINLKEVYPLVFGNKEIGRAHV